MTYAEFLNWQKYNEQKINKHSTEHWYYAYICYYIYNLQFILGGTNKLTVKDFLIKFEQEKAVKQDNNQPVSIEESKKLLAASLGMTFDPNKETFIYNKR